MMAPKEVLDYTVLDLCEETYHDKLGFTVLDILNHEGGKRFCAVVCINSIRCDNKRTYEMLLAEKKLQNPEIELLPIPSIFWSSIFIVAFASVVSLFAESSAVSSPQDAKHMVIVNAMIITRIFFIYS